MSKLENLNKKISKAESNFRKAELTLESATNAVAGAEATLKKANQDLKKIDKAATKEIKKFNKQIQKFKRDLEKKKKQKIRAKKKDAAEKTKLERAKKAREKYIAGTKNRLNKYSREIRKYDENNLNQTHIFEDYKEQLKELGIEFSRGGSGVTIQTENFDEDLVDKLDELIKSSNKFVEDTLNKQAEKHAKDMSELKFTRAQQEAWADFFDYYNSADLAVLSTENDQIKNALKVWGSRIHSRNGRESAEEISQIQEIISSIIGEELK